MCNSQKTLVVLLIIIAFMVLILMIIQDTTGNFVGALAETIKNGDFHP